MTINKSISFASALALTALIGWTSPAMADCGADHGNKAHASSAKADIVDTAVEAGNFKTLVAAVQAAGLVEALKGEGPFTVFAPTDDAFAALPEGTVESLLKEENRGQLVSILKYHVVSGKVMGKQAMKLDEAATLADQTLSLKVKDGDLMINDAKVVSADIKASNGVIHVIDKVLIPGQGGGTSSR